MATQGPLGVGAMQARRCVPRRGGSLRRVQKPCQAALGILPRLNVPRHGGGFAMPSVDVTWLIVWGFSRPQFCLFLYR